jgi:hypothetical protein
LNMVEKVCFKRALKTEKQKWEFLGKNGSDSYQKE